MKKINTDYKIINYGSGSVDIALKISKYLPNTNYFQASEVEKIKILENGFTNYSVIKLLEWNKSITDLKQLEPITLNKVIGKLDKFLTNENDNKSYFMQYIIALIYFLDKIYKDKMDDEISEYVKIERINGIIMKVIPNQDIKISDITIKIINHMIDIHSEKVPILTK